MIIYGWLDISFYFLKLDVLMGTRLFVLLQNLMTEIRNSLVNLDV